MSVLIKRMAMPKDCFECVFFDEEHNWCDMQDEHLHNQKDKTGRAKWCPLVKVPTPHGDLIDKDLLPEQFAYADYNFEMALEYAPTVIEAED